MSLTGRMIWTCSEKRNGFLAQKKTERKRWTYLWKQLFLDVEPLPQNLVVTLIIKLSLSWSTCFFVTLSFIPFQQMQPINKNIHMRSFKKEIVPTPMHTPTDMLFSLVVSNLHRLQFYTQLQHQFKLSVNFCYFIICEYR